MKLVISALVFLAASIAIAAPAKVPKTESQKICDTLQDKIDIDCGHIMCDSGIRDGNFKDLNDCMTASDYGEAAQAACDGEPTIEDAVKDYNQAHVSARLECN